MWLLNFFGGVWAKFLLVLAFVGGIALWILRMKSQARQEGRREVEARQAKQDLENVEKANRAESDVGSGSERDKRLHDRFRRD